MKKYSFKIGGKNYDVAVQNMSTTDAQVVVNGKPYSVELNGSGATPATHAGKSEINSADSQPTDGGVVRDIKSPLPGAILEVKVAKGDSVKAGQTLIVLEAMKMENNIDASGDGVVKSIEVKQGETVLEGALLITFE